jgi:hypothetical protein
MKEAGNMYKRVPRSALAKNDNKKEMSQPPMMTMLR